MGERYEIPPEDIDSKIDEIQQKLTKTREMVGVIQKELQNYLTSINSLEDSDCSAIQVYKWYLAKERSLYHALNKLKAGEKLLIGLFWLPDCKISELTS